eukprot:CAMPEP_0197827726 /NCGR_PEP_ID=MMETSP1437-20131217/4458_1 /TAXON_ID=49252 ORGANISM="Eucampia antarctica, Strain CCMP1452" /NCGR_SAMPLE_ID=MMETSP1437 /ASSEMBLY_ACC=CAM_ASM_001096 /LENGTH=145 /DNA_ID=CAMNT_0043428701 /DNA_START=22 /DNA_END=456 /DNA_ORIENTATION=+
MMQCIATSSIISSWNEVPFGFQVSFALLVIYFMKDAGLSVLNLIYMLVVEYVFTSVPTLEVKLEEGEASDDGVNGKQSANKIELKDASRLNMVQCYDPSTLQHLGEIPAMKGEEVDELCLKAKKAQKSWNQTTFSQRRLVMRTIQ